MRASRRSTCRSQRFCAARSSAAFTRPGAPVPSETQLMQRFEVARLTARKAVRVLVADGLVEVVPGRGAYVAER
jgi:DNA-binding GntR family transcriptional regulator